MSPGDFNGLDLPRFTAIDGVKLEREIYSTLSRADLVSVIIITFTFSAGLTLGVSKSDGGQSFKLFRRLEQLGSECEVIFVTSNAWKEYDNQRRGLARLVRAGVDVRVLEDLHAKIYLFEQDNTKRWIVGSANMTMTSMSKNTEVAVRGFHTGDFEAVRKSALRIVETAVPITL